MENLSLTDRWATKILSLVRHCREVAKCHRADWFIKFITSFFTHIIFYHCVYMAVFCILVFNSVIYVFLLLCLCIFIVYVFLLLCMLCSVYSVFIAPAGTLRLPWLRFFRAFPSVVRQMPRYNSQRRGTARTLPKLIGLFCFLCVNVYCTAATGCQPNCC